MVLGILPIIMIAVAGGLGLFICAYVAITLVIWRKHKAQLEVLERQLIAKGCTPQFECANVFSLPVALRKSTHSPHNMRADWGMLSSVEDLPNELIHPARRAQKRKSSDMLSWPLPRRSSRRGVPMEKIRSNRLSTVPEGPQNHISLSTFGDSNQTLINGPANPLATSKPTCASESQDSRHAQEPSSSPRPDVSSSEASRPRPLVIDRRTSEDIFASDNKPLRNRSVSVPTIALPIQRTPNGEVKAGPHKHTRGSRSMGLGSASEGPTAPLPSPPTMSQKIEVRPCRFDRSESNDSLGSSISISSSFLKTANIPNLKTRNSFSQRHPDVGLIPQIREQDTDLKDSLIVGPRHMQVSPRMIQDSPRRIPSTVSVLLGSTRTSEVTNHVSIGTSAFVEKLRAARTNVQTPPPGRDESPRYNDQHSPTRAVNSAESNPQSRWTSETSGSPSDQPRRRASPLQMVFGNSCMPPRELSQTSITSAASTVSNGIPFQWDSPRKPPNRSAMKGSPTAKGKHKRQNCVRIQMTPTVLGPSRSSSRRNSGHMDKMVDIAEESLDGQLGPINQPRHLKPPSSTSLEPRIQSPASYRASLTNQSPTLLLNRYFDSHVAIASIGRVTRRTESTSPDRRASTASSILSIPAFPIRGVTSSKLSPDLNTKTSEGAFEDVETHGHSSAVPSSTTSRTIPGLTLLQQRQPGGLQYPTIDLASSPESVTGRMEASPPAPPLSTKSTAKSPTPVESPTSLPRNLSPPPKSTATTQITQDTPHVAALRITPRSSVANPMEAKPDFAPPSSEAHLRVPPSHPAGLRAQASLTVLVKGLRRDNSDAFRWSPDSQGNRNYLRMQRSASPEIDSPTFGHSFYESYSDKENRPYSTSWEDGGEVFGEDCDLGFALNKAETQAPLRSASKKAKRVAWGENEYRESAAYVRGDTPTSLYDKDGFLV